ncbi:MAG: hypothetical protein Q9160_006674 [Pyrenula sp. 1 TL-2023]
MESSNKEHDDTESRQEETTGNDEQQSESQQRSTQSYDRNAAISSPNVSPSGQQSTGKRNLTVSRSSQGLAQEIRDPPPISVDKVITVKISSKIWLGLNQALRPPLSALRQIHGIILSTSRCYVLGIQEYYRAWFKHN